MKTVLGYGPVPSPIMFVGEAPGKVEARTGIPFSGPSGDLQSFYLSLFGLSISSFYRTNVCKTYTDGNPDPTYSQIQYWTPYLLAELEEVSPKLIVAVGRFAANWFLSSSPFDGEPLDLIHGVPHLSTREGLPESVRDSIILPIFHPASGLYNYERKSYLRWDYEQVADIYSKIHSGNRDQIHIRQDLYKGKEQYLDITGEELEEELQNEYYLSLMPEDELGNPIIGFDTEGTPSNPWSLQISLFPGTGYLLRTSQPDFKRGISSLESFLRSNRVTVAMHQASTPTCACYDIVMSRAMGLNLHGIRWWDTLYWSYLQRLESMSLSTLSTRWLGTDEKDYKALVAGLARDKQIAYLHSVMDLNLPKPDKISTKENDGTISTRQPQSISRTAERIILDILENKLDKDLNPPDPYKRWEGVDNPEQKKLVLSLLGPIPTASLADVPLSEATYYACGDSDKTLRLALSQISRSDSRILSLQQEGMLLLPHIERMQDNGMPVSRSYFLSLRSEMEEIVDRLGKRLSILYNDGKPINPNSSQQIAALCRRRGLKGKKTEKGFFSTNKDSIGQYRYTDEAIELVFDWREAAHNRDYYCNDVLERTTDSPTDICLIRSNIKMCTVHTRRPASENPNILGIPTRTEIGRKIRHGYIAPPGKVWCSYDLSGVEMRVMASESRCPVLSKVFLDKIHPHRFTASRLFGVDIGEVKDTQKAVGKEANFLTQYGGGYGKLYEKLRAAGISNKDLILLSFPDSSLSFTSLEAETERAKQSCKVVMSNWFKTYYGVDAYRKRVIEKARREEIVYDRSGMPRYLPGINSDDSGIRAEEERAAVSQIIQGTATTAIRNSIIWLMPRLDELSRCGELSIDYFRLYLHDELIFLVDIGQEETLSPIVLEGLTKHHGIELSIPLEAEEHIGYTWGECK